MADVKWIKIITDIFDDEKIKLIDSMPDNDAIIVIWFKLLAQAGKSNQNGALFLNSKMAYTEEMLSTVFNRKVSTVRLALDTFEKLDMIERGDYIQISNWEKHQNIEGMERVRLLNAERNRKYRQRKKIDYKPNDVSVTSRDNTELELEEELDIKLKDKKSGKSTHATNRFIKPTVEEIKAYCEERNNKIDAKYFYDKNESIGWVVGKTCKPMKDWKAVVRTWEGNQKQTTKGKSEEPDWVDDYMKDLAQMEG